ncbi:WG repeat-containing protein [bacterium]|nr:MAG: WG repeat-containing protein [bacterium]
MNKNLLVVFGFVLFFTFSFCENVLAQADLVITDSDGKKGVFNKTTQQTVVANQFDDYIIFEGFIISKRNGLFGLIDANGNELLGPIFPNESDIKKAIQSSKVFENRRKMQAQFQNRWEDLDLITIQQKQEKEKERQRVQNDVYSFDLMLPKPGDEGFIFVSKGGKYGYATRDNKVVIEPQFEEVNRFSGGLGRVKVNGKWGFVDKTGKLVIPAKYDSAGDFFDKDYIYVSYSGKNKLLTKSGVEKEIFTQAAPKRKARSGGGSGVKSSARFQIYVNYERIVRKGVAPGPFMEMEASLKVVCDGKTIETSSSGIETVFDIVESDEMIIDGIGGIGYRAKMRDSGEYYMFFFYDLSSGFSGNKFVMYQSPSVMYHYSAR